MADVVAASGLTCRIGNATVVADAALTVGEGELVALVGPNGAGKTSLLRCLAGLQPCEGTVAVAGRPLADFSRRERARAVGYLPQGHVFHWPLPVAEIVALGRLPLLEGRDLGDSDRTAVAEAMAATGIGEFADRPVTTLSGGERARVALARVLATGAPVTLADEPTAALDLRYQILIAGLLRARAKPPGGALVVLHDLALAARFADRVVLMNAGRIVAAGAPRTVLTPETIATVYGVGIDVLDVAGAPVPVATGLAPDPGKR